MSPDRTAHNDSVDPIVAELTRLHGEEGLSPTADTWRRILIDGADTPLRVVNLLAFGPGDGTTTGADAYSAYQAATAGAFQRVGGRLIAHRRLLAGTSLDAADDWDLLIETEYPSGRALADMWLDPEFVAAHAHREAGVRRSIATFSVAKPSG